MCVHDGKQEGGRCCQGDGRGEDRYIDTACESVTYTSPPAEKRHNDR